MLLTILCWISNLPMILFSTIFCWVHFYLTWVKESWKGVLVMFSVLRDGPLSQLWRGNQHWNPIRGATVCIPISLDGRNPSWKLTEGQKLISGSLAPSQLCHPGFTSSGSLWALLLKHFWNWVRGTCSLVLPPKEGLTCLWAGAERLFCSET